MATKLHFLRGLFLHYLEPNDIINDFPQDTGLFTTVGDEIRAITGNSDQSRQCRVDKFLYWFEEAVSNGDNILQQLIDIFNNGACADTYKWLVPILSERETFNEEFWNCLERVQKIDKVKRILRCFFPTFVQVCNARDIVENMRLHLSPSDREEIDKVAEVEANHRALCVLLDKLICKKPSWIDAFISTMRKLNYGLGSHMLEDSVQYRTLADALEDFFDECNQGQQEENMEVEEHVESMNESSVKLEKTSKVPSVKDSDQLYSHKDMEKSGMKLREYQIELCKKALAGENVVIWAPTGSGKTYVAAHIIEKHLESGSDTKVAFFAPTGGLAEQQYGKMKTYLPGKKDKVAILHGNMDTEFNKDFKKKIYSSDIVVMTPRILLNCLENRSVTSLFDFSLMIFDECHHARASHPYSEILKKYSSEEKIGKKIQIVGLTATLGIGTAEDVETAKQHVFKLLGMLDATGGIESVKNHADKLNVSCPRPTEDVMYIGPDAGDGSPFKHVIMDTVKKVQHILTEMGAYTILKVPLLHCSTSLNKEFEEWCQKLRLAAEGKIVTVHGEESKTLGRDSNACASTLMCLKRAHDLCHNCRPSDVTEEISRFDKRYWLEHQEKNTEVENRLHDLLNDATKKLSELEKDSENKMLQKLEERIQQKYEEDPDFRCMIMVSRRRYTMCLKGWVNDSPRLKEVGSDIYIGVGTKSSDAMPGMTHKKQSTTIERFKKGEIKVLVCTPDAAGEGIDIAQCNLVITIDCVKDEIKKVQLSGRARKPGSEVLHIYFKSDGTERDELTVKKQLLMQKTTREIAKMHHRNIEDYRRHLIEGRNDAIRGMVEAEQKRRNGPPPLLGRRDKFLCRNCNELVCFTDEIIRLKGSHHVVSDPSFRRKYSKTRHDSRGEECWKSKNMRYVNRILCAKCKREWGNEIAWGEHLVPILAIKGLKILDRRGKVHCPSQWKKTRLNIKESKFDSGLCEFLFEKYSPEDIGPKPVQEDADTTPISGDITVDSDVQGL